MPCVRYTLISSGSIFFRGPHLPLEELKRRITRRERRRAQHCDLWIRNARRVYRNKRALSYYAESSRCRRENSSRNMCGYRAPVSGQPPAANTSLSSPTRSGRGNIRRQGRRRSQPHNANPTRTQRPATGPVYILPATFLFPPPPPNGLQLPPGVPPPPYPQQLPPRQPPATGSNVPPRDPTTVSSSWIAPAGQAAQTSALPTQSPAPPLSKEKLHSEQHRLEDGEKKTSKPEASANYFARKVFAECKKSEQEKSHVKYTRADTTDSSNMATEAETANPERVHERDKTRTATPVMKNIQGNRRTTNNMRNTEAGGSGKAQANSRSVIISKTKPGVTGPRGLPQRRNIFRIKAWRHQSRK